MGTKSDFRPAETGFMAIAPGAVLEAELEERSIKHKDFAAAIGMSPSHFSELIKGKIKVTTKIAERLENQLGIPAIQWLNFQTQYEYDQAVVAKREADKSLSLMEQLQADIDNMRLMYERLGMSLVSCEKRMRQLQGA